MKNSGTLLIGMIAAAAVGAAVGIAYAPDKGLVTRKKLKKKINRTAEDLKDYIDEKKNNSVEKVTELVDLGKEKAKEITSAYNAKAKSVTS